MKKLKTNKHARWAMGHDLGVTEYGLVLHKEDDDAATAWATFTCGKGYRNRSATLRVFSLAELVCTYVVGWIHEYGIAELDSVIETPVLGRNPAGFALQTRLLQEVEHRLHNVVTPFVGQHWRTLVSPGTSKRVATGDGHASKLDVLLASPFDGPQPKDYKGTSAAWYDTQEAMADAWAHSMCAYGKGGPTASRMDMTDLNLIDLDPVYFGGIK